ncbi:uncharacterized protein LOC110034256, partial [Phalaenopsis equestris]|uniref:uncharacterized protein LOC110034256 n=1 Tax=Phalaenopsis equestris TaxID=78828 RepID=UPI0009E2C89B
MANNSTLLPAMTSISRLSRITTAAAATTAAKASPFRPAAATLFVHSILFPNRKKFVAMAAVEAAGSTASAESLVVKPPSHPTYDIKAVIALALAEDAGDL